MAEGTSIELPLLPSWKMRCAIVAGFAALLFLVYGVSLRNDFVRWDDGLLIYENPAVREVSLRSLKTIFTTYDPELYIPFTLLSYKLDYLLGGTNPFVYHLHNLILHTLNAILVLWFIYLLTSNKLLALAVGLVFAIHPLHTEAVVWASARKDLLSTFFFLSSLIAYLYYRESKKGQGRTVGKVRTTSIRTYVVSVLLFLCGLMAKVMVITLPLTLFLMDWREGRPPFAPQGASGGKKVDRRMLLEKVPYVLLSMLFGVIALYGKRGLTAGATLWETVLMANKSMVFYLQKLFVPTNLSVLYPYTESIRFSSPDFFVPFFLVVLLFALMLLPSLPCSSQCREGEKYQYTSILVSLSNALGCAGELGRNVGRNVVFGLLFFLFTLAPTFVNFSKDGEFYFASDRYAYIPSIGVLFALGFLLSRFLEAGTNVRVMRQKLAVTIAACLGVAFLFSVLTVRQSLIWNNTETLFRNVLAHYQNSHRARNNLANALRRQGLLPLAIEEFKAALAIREHPKTLSNLGAVYRKLGRISEALALYEKALAIAPDDPEPHFGLGIVYAQQATSLASDVAEADKLQEMALASYERALVLDPRYVDVYNNIGALYAQRGEFDHATEAYKKALSINPLYYQAHYNLGVALESLGDIPEAVRAYAEALDLEPTFTPARINLALLLYSEGKVKEAKEQLEAVLVFDPQNPRAAAALKQLQVREMQSIRSF